MNAYFRASDWQGGGRVRSFWPAEMLGAKAGIHLPRDHYDDVVIHRPLSKETLDDVIALRAEGTRVLIDEDDDLDALDDTENPIAKLLFQGDMKQRHSDAIAEADGLIVTTPALADVYGSRAREVFVVPNYLPARIGVWQFRQQADGLVRVGWAGIVKTHAQDLRWIRPAFDDLIAGARFATVGDPRTARLLGYDGPVDYRPFQDEEDAFYSVMRRCDIGIVPLKPCRFNVAKSWLKALEYMTLGKPVVATDLPEQRALIRHGVDGFLASTPEDFAAAVQTLVHDDDLRVAMGQSARQRAASMTLERRGDIWKEVLFHDRDAAGLR